MKTKSKGKELTQNILTIWNTRTPFMGDSEYGSKKYFQDGKDETIYRIKEIRDRQINDYYKLEDKEIRIQNDTDSLRIYKKLFEWEEDYILTIDYDLQDSVTNVIEMNDLQELNSYLKDKGKPDYENEYEKEIEMIDQGSIIELLSTNCYYEESRMGRKGEVEICNLRLKKKK